MSVTDRQVRKLLMEYQKSGRIMKAALKAGHRCQRCIMSIRVSPENKVPLKKSLSGGIGRRTAILP